MKRKNMMGRNLAQTIRRSLGRYIAILAIVALGAGLFCGLRVTKVDMVATVQDYTDRQNMFDLQVMNSYGWTAENVAALSALPGIANAEGGITQDTLVHFGNNDDSAFKLISLPESVSTVSLTAGRMPQAPDECLLDGFYANETLLGRTVYISSANEEAILENLAFDRYTVVGLVSTPLYLNMQRGSTTIGNGSLSSFLYIPREGFSLEFYTEINLTLQGDYDVYTDHYNDAMDAMAGQLESDAQDQANLRFETILRDAMDEYLDGRREYLEGMTEYREGKAEAEQELADARKELEDGQAEFDENKATLDNARRQLSDAGQTLAENRQTLTASRAELERTRQETYAQLDGAKAELDQNHSQITEGLAQVNDGLAQIESGITQLEDGIAQIDAGLDQLQSALPLLDAAAEAARAMLQVLNALPVENAERIEQLKSELAELIAQRDTYARQQEELIIQRSQLVAQLAELEAQHRNLLATKAELEIALIQINDGYAQLEQGRLEADARFSEAEAQLRSGEEQLSGAQALLNEQWNTLSDGEVTLAEAAQTLADGWQEYYDGKAEAEQELADAEAELRDARLKLADAREDIASLESPALYVLTRNTNLGYVVFESDSDIVSGIAEIFPVFFLAVAALVYITTMTRMIDEERTQIGILKALGYSNSAIMGKYLGYSGSACLLGCLLGLLLGSTVFPRIIWNAYCIMYGFSDDLVLSYDIGTILFIFVSYLGLTLLVTWNCCRRELMDVPAELIRPRPPVSGKQIWLEKLPFWKRLKFLNKVAIRNIFRYRQRLAMMLLGIGGCTALLVTGFGLTDSIAGIADRQYSQIILYDIGLTFGEELDQTARDQFRAAYPGQDVFFCQQGGIDLEFENSIKNVNLIATDEDLRGFINLRQDGVSLSMPGQNEVLISIGAAAAMDIETGDVVTLRNSDMEELTLKVSGIFDNNVHNYAIVNGQTLRTNWGRSPEIQTAYVRSAPGQDVHELGAALAGWDGLISININQDAADNVGSMMDALDAVILVVVICAGALACIVLYNLTNINIQERIREIATIKVLGFHAGESASYVFKENLTLTFFGTALGLLAGKVLHTMVMSYVRIDMVWFDNVIHADSYVMAAALTILAALIVDLVMYFKLDKINMAEALKSVE